MRTLACQLLLVAGLWLTTQPLYANPASLQVCTDYECDHRVRIQLQPQQRQHIQQLFAGVNSPDDERARIARYIAFMETVVGQATGTWRDRARNDPLADPRGQLDCIAESTNTDRYLQFLDSQGLLRWHEPMPREVRHLWLVRTHWTAVIADRQTGERLAVDSWFRDNGQPPLIVALDDWRSGSADPED